MKKVITGSDTIGSVVAADYKTSAIFYRYDIDFCCKGDRKIEDVCTRQKIDADLLIQEVNDLLKGFAEDHDVSELNPDALITHILETHHRYVTNHIPVILEFLNKLCSVHGNKHPELFDIYHLFEKGAMHLLEHMNKEEDILFPMIRKMVLEQQSGRRVAELPFSTQMPIRMMRQEHEEEGDRFALIAGLTDQYTPPADACATYRATFMLLKEFEKDLHRHIHLENNVLFPAALEMEENN